MNKRMLLFVAVPALLCIGVASAQHPLLDTMADGVVARYQSANCEQLWAQKGAPKTPREQEAIQMLRNDAQMRHEFINRVAAPIVNKLFECGLVP
jgi:hypothetical protein